MSHNSFVSRCGHPARHVVAAGLFVSLLTAATCLTEASGPQIAFASNTASSVTSEADGAIVWSIDSDCTGCHSTQATYLSLAPETETSAGQPTTDQHSASSANEKVEEKMVGMAADHTSAACIDCHADEQGLTKVHEDVTEVEESDITRLKKTAVNEDFCFTCHTSWEDLAELTADCTVLTDNEGTVVNPHDFPNVAEHEDITCDSCHYMHKEKTSEETAAALCGSCHHAGVYECYTCH